jgi:hypothetical protein
MSMEKMRACGVSGSAMEDWAICDNFALADLPPSLWIVVQPLLIG